MKNIKYILLILLFFSSVFTESDSKLKSQLPIGAVFDVSLSIQNTITLTAEALMQFLLKKEAGFATIIGDVNTFFSKARTVVNHSVKNMRLVRSIVDLNADILEQYQLSIQLLNNPIDQDDDGVEDMDLIKKWQHIQILLAIVSEAGQITELLTNLVEEDAFVIDDKGRILLLQNSYKDLIKVKSAILAHRRRINRTLFKYQLEKRTIQAYQNIFN